MIHPINPIPRRALPALVTAALALLALLSSCKTPTDIAYLQGVSAPIATQTDGFIRFQPGDKLSIFVHSRDEQLMQLFNITGGRNGSMMMTGGAGGSNYAGYTIDPQGEIDFPVLGQVKVAGLTRKEVSDKIKDMLIGNSLCNDPVVTVEFSNLTFSVIGDAGTGVKQITKDRITILEAVAMAGDLSITGQRRNVLVLRQEGNVQVPYRVDLTSAESVYGSPVYYIRQNDVVYIEPNDMRKRSSTVMGSQAYTPSFWFSMFSSVMSVALLILNIVK